MRSHNLGKIVPSFTGPKHPEKSVTSLQLSKRVGSTPSKSFVVSRASLKDFTWGQLSNKPLGNIVTLENIKRELISVTLGVYLNKSGGKKHCLDQPKLSKVLAKEVIWGFFIKNFLGILLHSLISMKSLKVFRGLFPV